MAWGTVKKDSYLSNEATVKKPPTSYSLGIQKGTPVSSQGPSLVADTAAIHTWPPGHIA